MLEYAAELLPLLAQHYDIELIAASSPIETPAALARHYLILTAREALARHAALPYDIFLHQLSPPLKHLDMLDLLWQFPGMVVLHDFSEGDLRWLAENKVLRPHNAGDSPEGGKSAAGDFAPVLGVLVHSAAAWQQVRRALNVPVVHLPRPSSVALRLPPLFPPPWGGEKGGGEQAAAAYAAWIDLAIDRHEQSDGRWRGFAVQCLTDCAEEAGAVIDSWAALRASGQQHFACRRPRPLAVAPHSSAA